MLKKNIVVSCQMWRTSVSLCQQPYKSTIREEKNTIHKLYAHYTQDVKKIALRSCAPRIIILKAKVMAISQYPCRESILSPKAQAAPACHTSAPAQTHIQVPKVLLLVPSRLESMLILEYMALKWACARPGTRTKSNIAYLSADGSLPCKGRVKWRTSI